jgi:Family of unknown function (DUF6208)
MTQNKLSLLWEIPLAILSLIFYKVMKFILGNLYTIYLYFNQDKSRQWRILSTETLNSFLFLPVLMTKGPRWNTHAIIGTLGPFSVNNSLTIERTLADESAQSWIAVIYSFPNYQTIGNINSTSDLSSSVILDMGQYTLGMRYYNYQDKVTFPVVKADGIAIVEPQESARDVNQVYHSLADKQNWFYLCLHYYVFTLLKWRDFLPASLIYSEFLPVGSPDTDFFYGALSHGEVLQLEIESKVLENFEVYITVYNRASFPLFWWQQQQQIYQTEVMVTNGFYLLRVRRKSNPTSDSGLNWRCCHQDNVVMASLKE